MPNGVRSTISGALGPPHFLIRLIREAVPWGAEPMSAQKPVQPNGNGTSPADVSEEQSRSEGQRALERMGLMSFERPGRNPYHDLDVLSLSYSPRRAERKLIPPPPGPPPRAPLPPVHRRRSERDRQCSLNPSGLRNSPAPPKIWSRCSCNTGSGQAE